MSDELKEIEGDLCPLMSIGAGRPIDCYQDQCAWWVKKEAFDENQKSIVDVGSCAIRQLDRIKSAIHLLREWCCA